GFGPAQDGPFPGGVAVPGDLPGTGLLGMAVLLYELSRERQGDLGPAFQVLLHPGGGVFFGGRHGRTIARIPTGSIRCTVAGSLRGSRRSQPVRIMPITRGGE